MEKTSDLKSDLIQRMEKSMIDHADRCLNNGPEQESVVISDYSASEILL